MSQFSSTPFLGRGPRGGSQRGLLIEYHFLLNIIVQLSRRKNLSILHCRKCESRYRLEQSMGCFEYLLQQVFRENVSPQVIFSCSNVCFRRFRSRDLLSDFYLVEKVSKRFQKALKKHSEERSDQHHRNLNTLS
ncbi:hypothetical protein MNBD_PLANCTO02-344 [hydrothermal vent metagenome]|uniref:Uncharacterized protein n=1 Tax=hydrothermal vent metagenome TaxID=652676 RepID=A0A3B1D232_9ZZZZ